MAQQAKLFIDFWNFQLDWNKLTETPDGRRVSIPWNNTLQKVILQQLSEKHGSDLVYDGTHVYASVDKSGDGKLRNFLMQTMRSFPGYSVKLRERKARPKPIHCKACKNKIVECPNCNRRLKRGAEKGVDVTLVTDLIQMAFDNVYDVAVLGSNDADFCQAVNFIQERTGKRVYHLWFPGIGVDLRNTCWDHIDISDILADLTK